MLKILKDYINSGGKLWEGRGDEYPAILSFIDIKEDHSIKILREKSLRSEIEGGPVCVAERVEYAIKEFNLNPKEGWLKKSLEKILEKWGRTNEKFELSSVIYIGKNYRLLTQEEIEKLERKLKLVERLKE